MEILSHSSKMIQEYTDFIRDVLEGDSDVQSVELTLNYKEIKDPADVHVISKTIRGKKQQQQQPEKIDSSNDGADDCNQYNKYKKILRSCEEKVDVLLASLKNYSAENKTNFDIVGDIYNSTEQNWEVLGRQCDLIEKRTTSLEDKVAELELELKDLRQKIIKTEEP
ncbi:Hypothetical predicted protein [Mytilus galloprovincialis]|uniref:Uncharacterized protein n=1 Tax=Mytilus galloprovincialis TaxID=29158 RepID=A0A8B6E2K4_MYTGA|nr:Hypothetical predicted protein [Mytilus galloprovincialis]